MGIIRVIGTSLVAGGAIGVFAVLYICDFYISSLITRGTLIGDIGQFFVTMLFIGSIMMVIEWAFRWITYDVRGK